MSLWAALRRMPRIATLFALALGLAAGAPAVARAAPVLMISVDGLRPGDVIEARERGLRLPILSGLVSRGAYATGVRGVLPTVTYPNHTTLVTGASPARHGIGANLVFDPWRRTFEAWNWYFPQIKVGTLWGAVHAAHGKVASLYWPVTVDAPVIDVNLPEYWRTRAPEDLALLRALSTRGLIDKLERASGTSLGDALGATPETDAALARLAAALMRTEKPRFSTIHLASVDHLQHSFGPGSPEAIDAIERMDADLGVVIAAARAAQPDLVVAIVSDHGFAPVTRTINLVPAFIEAGLITYDKDKRRVTAWEASPWPAGGSVGVVLARPDDQALAARVRSVLDRLAADPENGIERVIDAAAARAFGAAPEAAFWVGFKPGWATDSSPLGPAQGPSAQKGTHGYFPDLPEMRATFLIEGPGLPVKGSLGEIDMRDIAPTLARVLGVRLPDAEGRALF